MEDSFKVRVETAFGSLSSPFSVPLSSSLWCLTDEELEKRPWNRESESPADDDDEDPFPLDMDRLLSAKGKLGVDDENRDPNPNPNCNADAGGYCREVDDALQELDDEAGEGTSGRGPSTSCQSREAVHDEEGELDVRSSIGMGCTLDFEDEEDEYDKVAVGRETTGDRLYMSDASDYTPHVDSYNEIRISFKEASRYSRANHFAAKLRLKEDAEAAESFNSLHVSEPTVAVVSDGPSNGKDAEAARNSSSLHVSEQAVSVFSDSQNNKDAEVARWFNSLDESEQTLAVVSHAQNNASEDGKSLKSILKRKEDQISGIKSEKRVRFEPGCKDQNALHEEVSSRPQDSSLVPDYICNPSRYTHYSFDSLSDMSEKSNCQAYMDFLSTTKKPKQSQHDEVLVDLTKPVIFNPQKKATGKEAAQIKEITLGPPFRKSLPVSFASGERAEDEVNEMEIDDEQETTAMKVGNGKGATRQYCLKRTDELNDSDS